MINTGSPQGRELGSRCESEIFLFHTFWISIFVNVSSLQKFSIKN